MAVEEFPPIRKWFTELPWRAKPRVPLERASKTILETGFKSDVAFCLGPSIEKTNSRNGNLSTQMHIFLNPKGIHQTQEIIAGLSDYVISICLHIFDSQHQGLEMKGY